MLHFFSQLFRFFLKLVMAISAAIIGFGLLLVALAVLAFSLLKALVTGRKPAPFVAFRRFQQFSQQNMRSGGPLRHPAPSAASGQVVDVEVREIPDDGRQP